MKGAVIVLVCIISFIYGKDIPINESETCNCDPAEAPAICAQPGSDGVLVAHENCTQFYKCSHGEPVALKCLKNLRYNPYTQYCDWPENVDCGDRLIPDPEEDDDNNGDNNGGDGDNSSTDGPCNCDPSEAPAICAQPGSDGVLVAHENCTQFYKCSHGKPVGLRCLGNLLYNPYKRYCDFPENVNCGDRIIPEHDDNESDIEDLGSGDGDDSSTLGPCNCDPSEAPEICAQKGSDGVLVAHENCTQFYKCAHGEPVGLRCARNLLYNPYKQYCDWPENVNCGDRIIPDHEDDDNNDGDNNGEDGNETSTLGPCNCDPSEAPEICAQVGSDGVLVAHENCTQFYKCAHGVPVGLKCLNNLFYNPYKQSCDFPENVNCGDRLIPDPEDDDEEDEDEVSTTGPCNCDPSEAPAICAQVGSDGVLVAHENCTEFYKCAHGAPVSIKCAENLLYNPHKQYCDWPKNVDCGDRIIPEPEENDNEDDGGDDGGDDGDNEVSCNCDPSEAPAICAKPESDGILVAHENCDQYYICSHGRPLAMRCFGNLVYNPYKQYCDWPQNVDCGARVIAGQE